MQCIENDKGSKWFDKYKSHSERENQNQQKPIKYSVTEHCIVSKHQLNRTNHKCRVSIISVLFQTFYNESLDEKNINALLKLINISSQFLFLSLFM